MLLHGHFQLSLVLSDAWRTFAEPPDRSKISHLNPAPTIYVGPSPMFPIFMFIGTGALKSASH